MRLVNIFDRNRLCLIGKNDSVTHEGEDGQAVPPANYRTHDYHGRSRGNMGLRRRYGPL